LFAQDVLSDLLELHKCQVWIGLLNNFNKDATSKLSEYAKTSHQNGSIFAVCAAQGMLHCLLISLTHFQMKPLGFSKYCIFLLVDMKKCYLSPSKSRN
jgi:hypothetical protein